MIGHLQPRTLEIFRFLGILDDVLALGNSYKPRCLYKLPGGTEPLTIVETAPRVEPTPSVPYVNFVFKSVVFGC